MNQALDLVQAPPPAPARPPDWVETADLGEQLASAEQHGLSVATERMAALRCGWRPPPPRRFAAWLLARALAVDAATGQLHLAQGLLQVGLDLGLPPAPLEDALRASAQLRAAAARAADTAPYTGGVNEPGDEQQGERGECSGLWRVPLSEYVSLAPPARLALLLAGSSPDSLPDDVQRVVLPFLETLPTGERPALLGEAVALASREGEHGRLEWAAALLAAEAQQPVAFPGAAQVAEAAAGALACMRFGGGVGGRRIAACT